MKSLFLIAHIAGGGLGLLLGTWMLMARKGNARHKRLGRTYTLAMAVATLSGIVLARMGANDFLMYVGMFSFYLAYSGWRALASWRHNFEGQRSDRFIGGLTFAFALVMIYDAFMPHGGDGMELNPVQLIFGMASAFFSGSDLWLRRSESHRMAFAQRALQTHIGRMTGSYISAVTAFLVVNLSGMLPPLFIWLGPSVILGPMIGFWIRRSLKKPLQTAP